MITRALEKKMRELASYYPAVLVTGPRQSGKTTLCRMVFPDKTYISLEPLDIRDYARSDPRAFLNTCRNGAVVKPDQPEQLLF
jgi:uncharacterized protein